MNGYIGNQMVGMKQFNFPWFDAAEANIRMLVGQDAMLFNPANHDRANGFSPAPDSLGTVEEMRAIGFSRREALGHDYDWIVKHSEFMVIGPEWPNSTGTISEIAVHQALGLPVWEYAAFLKHYHDPDLAEWILPPIMEVWGPAPLGTTMRGGISG